METSTRVYANACFDKAGDSRSPQRPRDIRQFLSGALIGRVRSASEGQKTTASANRSRSCLEVDGDSRSRHNVAPSGGILFQSADAVETGLPSCRAGIIIGRWSLADSHHGAGPGIGASQCRQRRCIRTCGAPRWTIAPTCPACSAAFDMRYVSRLNWGRAPRSVLLGWGICQRPFLV
jgi:hypothetical protein